MNFDLIKKKLEKRNYVSALRKFRELVLVKHSGCVFVSMMRAFNKLYPNNQIPIEVLNDWISLLMNDESDIPFLQLPTFIDKYSQSLGLVLNKIYLNEGTILSTAPEALDDIRKYVEIVPFTNLSDNPNISNMLVLYKKTGLKVEFHMMSANAAPGILSFNINVGGQSELNHYLNEQWQVVGVVELIRLKNGLEQ